MKLTTTYLDHRDKAIFERLAGIAKFIKGRFKLRLTELKVKKPSLNGAYGWAYANGKVELEFRGLWRDGEQLISKGRHSFGMLYENLMHELAHLKHPDDDHSTAFYITMGKMICASAHLAEY